MVQHLAAGNGREVVALGTTSQAFLLPRLLGTVVTRDERVEPVAEGILQIVGHEERIDLADQQAAIAAPQGDHALGVGADLAPADPALALR